LKLCIVVHTCNPSTWEAKAGRSLNEDHPGLFIETLYKKKNKNKKPKENKDHFETSGEVFIGTGYLVR
jgi:hypothetical protein